MCEPVAGFVEVCPCVYRNGLHAGTALVSTESSLAGVCNVIPSDEVVSVMREVGQQLALSLRETGIGGLSGSLNRAAIGW